MTILNKSDFDEEEARLKFEEESSVAYQDGNHQLREIDKKIAAVIGLIQEGDEALFAVCAPGYEIPYYSMDMTACVAVIKWLISKGHTISIDRRDSRWVVSTCPIGGIDANLPLAICKLALNISDLLAVTAK
jgi:hypothetical protein